MVKLQSYIKSARLQTNHCHTLNDTSNTTRLVAMFNSTDRFKIKTVYIHRLCEIVHACMHKRYSLYFKVKYKVESVLDDTYMQGQL